MFWNTQSTNLRNAASSPNTLGLAWSWVRRKRKTRAPFAIELMLNTRAIGKSPAQCILHMCAALSYCNFSNLVPCLINGSSLLSAMLQPLCFFSYLDSTFHFLCVSALAHVACLILLCLLFSLSFMAICRFSGLAAFGLKCISLVSELTLVSWLPFQVMFIKLWFILKKEKNNSQLNRQQSFKYLKKYYLMILGTGI